MPVPISRCAGSPQTALLLPLPQGDCPETSCPALPAPPVLLETALLFRLLVLFQTGTKT